jgi:hypothetical protein
MLRAFAPGAKTAVLRTWVPGGRVPFVPTYPAVRTEPARVRSTERFHCWLYGVAQSGSVKVIWDRLPIARQIQCETEARRPVVAVCADDLRHTGIDLEQQARRSRGRQLRSLAQAEGQHAIALFGNWQIELKTQPGVQRHAAEAHIVLQIWPKPVRVKVRWLARRCARWG